MRNISEVMSKKVMIRRNIKGKMVAIPTGMKNSTKMLKAQRCKQSSDVKPFNVKTRLKCSHVLFP